ncbi:MULTISPECIES: TetR/AcrR family transcriptional regulator [unclassified Streptomyces]|uniref:TetR/AcrR family transcriptional regulator n=1 Tax=unclassified Streptomyces TaxID=2593676 RepID=UPI0023650A7E|nr:MULTISPECIES: TetR/AcrR family transcriptional regulator [unclassified Streptomyces]MDF3147764.1 TetR/AcrR family transcriptional regulator [Streptomyces sp. T21Q-yed]WDF44434.1 TetR/AcrR family transcriptional regulator [Streptomyces sp. T12]
MTEAPAQDRGAQSRDTILDTAGELMARHGYAATSISMISTACGLPVSSLYWHFGSKDGIYVAVLERARTALLAALPPAEVRGGDVVERLDTFLADVGDAFQRHQHGLRLLLGLGMVQQDASAAAVAEVRRYRDALVVWGQESVSAVFGLRDRPEVADELARFTLRMASGTAVARWFDAGAVLEIGPLRVALLALAAHHGVPVRCVQGGDAP